MTSELRPLYRAGIFEMAHIEQSILTHLPVMIAASSNTDLRESLKIHLEETMGHHTAMVKIMDTTAETTNPLGSKKTSFEVLMEETTEMLETLTSSATINAYIIAAAETVEHIEISKYKTLIEWSKALEDTANQSVFEEILASEEKAAKTLMNIGVGGFFTTGVIAEAVTENDLPTPTT